MTLRVIPVPDPPAGTDWQYTVPGMYLERITGITATLTTSPAVGPMADSSGHGRNGIYHQTTIADFVPGIVPGDLALEAPFGPYATAAYGEADTGVSLLPGDFTIEFWALPQFVGADKTAVVDVRSVDGTQFVDAGVTPDGHVGVVLFSGASRDIFTAAGAFPDDGVGHQVAIRYQAGPDTGEVYIDGVSVPVFNSGVPPAFTKALENIFVDDTRASVDVNFRPTIDEVSIYDTDIGAGAIAAHFAAGGTFAGYTAAVLASAPAAYYHLDDLAAGAGRTPGLKITDGTSETMLIGDGFAAQATPGPYRYSWQPQLASDTRDPTGTITTVALPSLLLPGGYTIGTRTPDLKPADQWSNIAVWWNDDIQQAVNFRNLYRYPPGVRLVYQQEQVPA